MPLSHGETLRVGVVAMLGSGTQGKDGGEGQPKKEVGQGVCMVELS